MNSLFKAAIDYGASDIHIEPNEDFILVRFRKD
jgi:type II secretory ATPase GspE/PulE/Tfp pilus assembly ATPase PilB-like protein